MNARIKNIALADANNFYARSEAIFRPDLARDGKVVVVLSNNDGCVVARSAEAKALGIKMGEPWFKLKDLAKKHNIIPFSSNYPLYADMSNRMMAILGQFSPVQEVYSIDESFLDLTGFHDVRDRALEMRETVRRWTGLIICVGIGPSKTLAKLSNHIAKKHPRSVGVFNYNALTPGQQENVLAHLAVEDVWGIGRKLNAKLIHMGIETVLQLRDADIPLMRKTFGLVMEKTIRELRGEECISMEELAPAKQQIVSSRSFGQAVATIHDLAEAVTHFVSTAAGKLRAQSSKAGCLTVFILTDRFREDRPQYCPSVSIPLPISTSDSMELANYAIQGLRQIFRDGYLYKKAGVILSDIGPEHVEQVDMFADAGGAELRTKLMGTMDAVNQRFGRGTLKLSLDVGRRAWAMKQEMRSPHYTTVWEDLPVCR